MATNIRVFGASPRLPVDVCVGPHHSGDLAAESGKFGICVEGNEIGQPNTLIERCNCVLPVPTGVVAGDKLYADNTLDQAWHSGDDLLSPPRNGGTIQAAPVRSAFVASTLTKTDTSNTLIGTAVTAAFYDGLTLVAVIELAPQ